MNFQIGGTTHLGWAQISTSVTNNSASAVLIDYAYNDVAYDGTNVAESSILAGETITATAPEPSSLALYAVGAAGILALRRRRKLTA